jgi:DNA-binding GntR family transcriptional regulator
MTLIDQSTQFASRSSTIQLMARRAALAVFPNKYPSNIPHPVRRPAKVNQSDAASRPVIVPVQRQTIASQALEVLRTQILRGHFPDGEALRQDALARQLGVSRIPIREALRQLEAEGLVTFTPHRGAVVSKLSLEEIDEVFALRADTETGLLRRAIPHLTLEHFNRLDEILIRYERALQRGEVAVWGELNWQFHSTLYAPAGRPITLGLMQRLHDHADRYVRVQLAVTHWESRASQEHRAIAAAARRKDTRRACALLRQHILSAGQSLVTFLREQREAESSAVAQAAESGTS